MAVTQTNITTDLQRKYRYSVIIRTHHDNVSHPEVPVDEFTPPDKRQEPVTRQNQKFGTIVLVGPPTYGEMTLRLALRITGDTANTSAALIESLQKLNEFDADTCEVVLVTKADVGGVEQTAYKQVYTSCRLTGYKLDALNRKGDDDMLHLELTLIPSRVRRIQGDQMLGV